MKKVVSKSEVAHLWANQIQNEARTSAGNFYFNEETIYSYGGHFPIASHCKGSVLFTTRSYSNSTAKHINITRSAASHLNIIYCHDPKQAFLNCHSENLKQFESEAKYISKSIPRSTKPFIYLDKIAYQKSLFEKYVNFFELKIDIKNFPYLLIVSKTGAIEASEAEKVEQEKARKKAEKARKIQYKKDLIEDQNKIELWKNFDEKFNYINLHLRVSNNTYLRLNAATNEIETSKGIKLPLEVAKRFYKWFNAVLLKGGCNGECNKKILDYEVKSVSKTGLIVGCHDITINEINQASKWLI